MTKALQRIGAPILGALAGAGLQVSGFQDGRVALAIFGLAASWGIVSLVLLPIATWLRRSKRHSDSTADPQVPGLADYFATHFPDMEKSSAGVPRWFQGPIRQSIAEGVALARSESRPLTTRHLLLGLLNRDAGFLPQILARAGREPDEIVKRLSARVAADLSRSPSAEPTVSVRNIINHLEWAYQKQGYVTECTVLEWPLLTPELSTTMIELLNDLDLSRNGLMALVVAERERLLFTT